MTRCNLDGDRSTLPKVLAFRFHSDEVYQLWSASFTVFGFSAELSGGAPTLCRYGRLEEWLRQRNLTTTPRWLSFRGVWRWK